MIIDGTVSLTRLVAYYRTAAAKLRRAIADNDGSMPTRFSESQVARMDWVIGELKRREEVDLYRALVREHAAHQARNEEGLKTNRSVIRKIVKVEKDAQRRADEALAYRLELVDRFETLYEVHQGGTEEERIAQTTTAQRLAWDRTMINIAVFEEKFALDRDSTKWYWTFLDFYDMSWRGRRIEFARELDGLIEWYHLDRARQAGFVFRARVVEELVTGARLGRIAGVNTVTNASRTATTVTVEVAWDDGHVSQGGMQHFTLLGDRSRLDLMEASISYRQEGSDVILYLDEGENIFEDAEDIVRQVLDLIESGATEVHIEEIKAV